MKKGITLLIITTIIFLLWQQDIVPKTKKHNININNKNIYNTSLQHDNPVEINPTIKSKKLKPEDNAENELSVSTKTKPHSGSYTKLYQDYSLAKFCKKASKYDCPLLQINEKNIEPMDCFYEIEDTDKATEQQRQSWELLFQDCEQLAIDYQQDESIINKLNKLLLSTKAETNKEKALKKVFLTVYDYQQIVLATKEKEGIANLKEIERLKNNIFFIKLAIDEIVNYDSKDIEYYDLENKLSQKETLLKEYVSSNDNYYNSLLNEHKNIRNQLITLLKSTEGLAFELVLSTVNETILVPDKYTTDTSEEDYLQIETFYDLIHEYSNKSRYYGLLTEPIMFLFSCYKGVDCAVDSQLSLTFCLGIEEVDRYPQACTKDLQNFLYEDYLSQNQLQDVKLIFNKLVADYD